jgi:BASS family bile acid:Na+ symporter
VLNLDVFGFILYAQFHLLLDIQTLGFVGMGLLLAASWGAGWLLGGSDSAVRKSMTLTTSLRNVGVGLVIATGCFPARPAVTAVLVYGIIEVLGSLLLAIAWGRAGRSAETARAQSLEPVGVSSGEDRTS